jgi:hypothetical protein
VIHGKPFLSTVASTRDWIEMERIHAGLARDRNADRFHDYENQTLALIAHDAMKPTMLTSRTTSSCSAATAAAWDRHHGSETQRDGLEQAGLPTSPGWTATTAVRWAAMRRLPIWCWKALPPRHLL